MPHAPPTAATLENSMTNDTDLALATAHLGAANTG